MILVSMGLFASACQDPQVPEATIQFRVDVAVNWAGDTLRAVLVNASDQTIGENVCGSSLARLEGGSWREVDPGFGSGPAGGCFGIFSPLEPSAEVWLQQPLPDTLSEGVYTLRTTIEVPWGSTHPVTIRSEAFRVES